MSPTDKEYEKILKALGESYAKEEVSNWEISNRFDEPFCVCDHSWGDHDEDKPFKCLVCPCQEFRDARDSNDLFESYSREKIDAEQLLYELPPELEDETNYNKIVGWLVSKGVPREEAESAFHDSADLGSMGEDTQYGAKKWQHGGESVSNRGALDAFLGLGLSNRLPEDLDNETNYNKIVGWLMSQGFSRMEAESAFHDVADPVDVEDPDYGAKKWQYGGEGEDSYMTTEPVNYKGNDYSWKVDVYVDALNLIDSGHLDKAKELIRRKLYDSGLEDIIAQQELRSVLLDGLKQHMTQPALESEGKDFDEFGDVDKDDIDRNFEKANPFPEAKAPRLGAEGWDDIISLEELMKLRDEEEKGVKGKKYNESFNQDAMSNINLGYVDDDDHYGIVNINADTTGINEQTHPQMGDDVIAPEDTEEIRKGYIPNPNAGLDDFKLDRDSKLTKGYGAIRDKKE